MHRPEPWLISALLYSFFYTNHHQVISMQAYAELSKRELIRKELSALNGKPFSFEECPGIKALVMGRPSAKPHQMDFHETMIGLKASSRCSLEDRVEKIAEYIGDTSHAEAVPNPKNNRPFAHCGGPYTDEWPTSK
jgi:hypothetical protein